MNVNSYVVVGFCLLMLVIIIFAYHWLTKPRVSRMKDLASAASELKREWNRGKIWRSIWNRGILLWWYRLWIRKDEFHKSLAMDMEAIWDMDDKEMSNYRDDVIRRREIFKERYFTKTDGKQEIHGKNVYRR
jgi:hypothetical protein